MRRAIRAALAAAMLSTWPASTLARQAPVPGASAQPLPDQAPTPVAGEHGHAAPAPPGSGDKDERQPPAPTVLPAFIPPLTDDDRAAAFPAVRGHAVHDKAVNSYVLFDRLEWQAGSGTRGVALDSTGWIGTDTSRFWFRAEGAGNGEQIEEAQVDLLYGVAISRWWGLVAGARQDFRPGEAQTWGAIGIQGLAPYWFEVEATAYIGAGGRTRFRGKAEYDLLLTNRLIVQPLLEIELTGKADPARGAGAGLNSADFGFRVRYEIRRELAPYVGIAWDRQFFGTRDYAVAAGERSGGARFVVGMRLWR